MHYDPIEKEKITASSSTSTCPFMVVETETSCSEQAIGWLAEGYTSCSSFQRPRVLSTTESGNGVQSCSMAMQVLSQISQSICIFLSALWCAMGEVFRSELHPSTKFGRSSEPMERLGFFMAGRLGRLGTTSEIPQKKGQSSYKKRQRQRKGKRQDEGRWACWPICICAILALVASTTYIAVVYPGNSYSEHCESLPGCEFQEDRITDQGGTGAAYVEIACTDPQISNWSIGGSCQGPQCYRGGRSEGTDEELQRLDHCTRQCKEIAHGYRSRMDGLQDPMGELHGYVVPHLGGAGRVFREGRRSLHTQAQGDRREDPGVESQTQHNPSKDYALWSGCPKRHRRGCRGNCTDRGYGGQRRWRRACEVRAIEDSHDLSCPGDERVHRRTDPCQIQVSPPRNRGGPGLSTHRTRKEASQDDAGGRLAPILQASKEVARSSDESRQRGAEQNRFRCLGWALAAEAIMEDGSSYAERLREGDFQCRPLRGPKSSVEIAQWKKTVSGYFDFKSPWQAQLEAVKLAASLKDVYIDASFSDESQSWTTCAVHSLFVDGACDSVIPHVSDRWCDDLIAGADPLLREPADTPEDDLLQLQTPQHLEWRPPDFGVQPTAHLLFSFVKDGRPEQRASLVAKAASYDIKSVVFRTYGYFGRFQGQRDFPIVLDNIHDWRQLIDAHWRDYLGPSVSHCFVVLPQPDDIGVHLHLIITSLDMADEVLILVESSIDASHPVRTVVECTLPSTGYVIARRADLPIHIDADFHFWFDGRHFLGSTMLPVRQGQFWKIHVNEGSNALHLQQISVSIKKASHVTSGWRTWPEANEEFQQLQIENDFAEDLLQQQDVIGPLTFVDSDEWVRLSVKLAEQPFPQTTLIVHGLKDSDIGLRRISLHTLNLDVVEEALLGLWPHFDFLAKKVHIVSPQPFDEDGLVVILEYFDLWQEPDLTLRPILHECLQPELDTLERVAWYCPLRASSETFPLERTKCRTEEDDYILHVWIRGQPLFPPSTFAVEAGDLVNIRFVLRNSYIERWVLRIFPDAETFKRELTDQTASEIIDNVTWTFIGATTPGTPAVIDIFRPAWLRFHDPYFVVQTFLEIATHRHLDYEELQIFVGGPLQGREITFIYGNLQPNCSIVHTVFSAKWDEVWSEQFCFLPPSSSTTSDFTTFVNLEGFDTTLLHNARPVPDGPLHLQNGDRLEIEFTQISDSDDDGVSLFQLLRHSFGEPPLLGPVVHTYTTCNDTSETADEMTDRNRTTSTPPVLTMRPNQDLQVAIDDDIPYFHRDSQGNVLRGRIIPPPGWDNNPVFRTAWTTGAAFRDVHGALTIRIRSWYIKHGSPPERGYRDFSMRPQLLVHLQDAIRRIWRDKITAQDQTSIHLVRPTPMADPDGARPMHFIIEVSRPQHCVVQPVLLAFRQISAQGVSNEVLWIPALLPHPLTSTDVMRCGQVPCELHQLLVPLAGRIRRWMNPYHQRDATPGLFLPVWWDLRLRFIQPPPYHLDSALDDDAENLNLMQTRTASRSPRRTPSSLGTVEGGLMVHVFHMSTEHRLVGLDRAKPLTFMEQINEIWVLPRHNRATELHQVSQPPGDLESTADATFILETTANRNRQAQPTDRLILFDLQITEAGRVDSEATLRKVLWARSMMTRASFLHLVAAYPFCQTPENDCALWINNVLWTEDGGATRQILHGDFLHLRVAGSPSMTATDTQIALCEQESADAQRYIFRSSPTPSPQDSPEAQESSDSEKGFVEDEAVGNVSHQQEVIYIPDENLTPSVDQSDYGGSSSGVFRVHQPLQDITNLPVPTTLRPHSEPKRQVHDISGRMGSAANCALRPIPDLDVHAPAKLSTRQASPVHISLEEQLGDKFCPMPKAPTRETGDYLDFTAVTQLHSWLDSALVIPQMLLPEDVTWHESTVPWITAPWWDYEKVDLISIYTDGSATKSTSGSAAVIWLQCGYTWFFGGYLHQSLQGPPCAHHAELNGILLGFHWLNHALSVLQALYGATLIPKVEFFFDATSAGYKAFGQWGGESYRQLVGCIRSLAYYLESRFGIEMRYNHVKGHSNDPGNEAADTVARLTNTESRFPSTWVTYFNLAFPEEVHWLWALWKPDWLDMWSGAKLALPSKPATKPHPETFGIKVEPFLPEPDESELTTIHCSVASANVLTLLPAKKNTELGLQGKARSEALQKTFHEAGYHIVGIQESRMRKEARIETEHYFVFSACATSRGTFGIQIWFSRALSLSENGHYFEKHHFKILAKDPRFLAIRVVAPFMRAIVIAAHAPTTQASPESVASWWQQLNRTIPAKFDGWARILLVDANARLGSIPSRAVDVHDEDEQDCNGELFHNYLLDNQLWVPSTFPETQQGPSGTWRHPKTQQWIRGDYVCLPSAWQLTSCSAYTDRALDISLRVDDHCATGATFSRKVALTPKEANSHRTAPALALDDLRVDLAGPNRNEVLEELVATIPSCSWHLDVHSHTHALQSGLQRWLFRRYKRPARRPIRQHMSEDTWSLVRKKQAVRRHMFMHNAELKHRLLKGCFSAWAKGDPSRIDETFEEAKAFSCALAEFRRLGKIVTNALRDDDRKFFELLAVEAGEMDVPGKSKILWQKIKWAFPKTRSRSLHQPLLMEALDAQWLPHFAHLEAGQPVTDTALFDRCISRQSTSKPSGTLQLSDLPTRLDVERALLSLKNNKASGPDGLPCELYRGAASILAAPLLDLYTKITLWQCEPVQCKGGLMMPIYKKGDPGLASSYRGIMMINVLSKVYHKWLRQQIMQRLSDIRMDTHLGGFPGQQAVYGAQCMQVFARLAHAHQLPAAGLFVDVQGAYHFLIRELVLGHIDPEDEKSILENLASWKAETKGVKLWLKTPSVLHRLRFPERLIALLREIHVDTWSRLPHLPDLLRSSRGSRPGSPLADAIYAILMIDVHSEMYRILEEHEGITKVFEQLEIRPFAVTWADDLALPIVAPSNSELLDFAGYIAKKVYCAFERRGLLLNMKPGKTMLVPAFRGPDAPCYRKTYLLSFAAGLEIEISQQRKVQLRCACSYKHLGMMFTPDGEVSYEVRCRLGQAVTALNDLRPVLFNNKRISVRTRLRLFESLIISRLCYGISAWGHIAPRLVRQTESFILRAQRQICGYPLQHGPSNDEMIGRFQLPTFSHRMSMARLKYATKLWSVGPATLQQMLLVEHAASSTSWWNYLVSDLQCPNCWF